jgi:hypothetical protein
MPKKTSRPGLCSIRVANSLFHHRPEKTVESAAKIEVAYHKAGAPIQKLVDLIAA